MKSKKAKIEKNHYSNTNQSTKYNYICTKCFNQKKQSNKSLIEKGMYAKFKTNKGEILIKLEFEKTPLTVANFVGLAEGSIKNNSKSEGEPYYDGLKFHPVIADFMIGRMS